MWFVDGRLAGWRGRAVDPRRTSPVGAVRQAGAGLGRNVRHSDRVLVNQVAGHKAERRPGAGEEWRAATKHEGAEVESILINKAKVGQASCQVWSCNCNLPNELGLQPAYHR